MGKYGRYFMTLRVDITGDNPDKAIRKLNEKIEELLTSESEILVNKGYSVDMGWNWSEHMNV